jgi:hypothetical protein
VRSAKEKIGADVGQRFSAFGFCTRLDGCVRVGQSLFVDQAIANDNQKTTLPPVLVIIALAAVLIVALILFFFDPARVAIYPVCPFHRLTGLDCPGCGGLRATHQLLHGNIVQALHFNALWVLSIPFLAWQSFRFLKPRFAAVLRSRTASTQNPGVPPQIAPPPFAFNLSWVWFYLVASIVFGIVRNLPVWK